MYPRFTLALLLLATQAVSAEVLFEAFYRIEKDGQHAGYFIERSSQDTAAGTKTLTMYIRQKQDGKEVFETYRSVAKAGTGEPVSSQHISTNTGMPLTITALFKNGVAKVSQSVNHLKALTDTSAKAPHLSSFLFFLADFRKMVPGNNYEYRTFAEERGRVVDGTMVITAEKNLNGQRILQAVNDFLGQPIESFVTEDGEPLGARRPSGEFSCFWVPNKEEAVGLFAYPTAEFTTLFGDLPEGKKNPWSKAPFKAAEFIKGFAHSEGSRSVSSQGKANKKLPLPLRKY